MALPTFPGIDYNWTFRGQAETVVGTFERIYVDGGFFKGDGDTNIEIRPDAAHARFLVNEKGQRNASGTITCEINIGGPLGLWRPVFNRWVGSLLATTVTARGVYVDDRKHEFSTELHPLDLIMGRVTGSMNREDWISNLASYRRLRPGVDLFAYRYAAASDDRKGPFHHGPPNSDTTRNVDLPIQLPPQPGPQWRPVVENRMGFAKKAQSQILGGGPGGLSFRLEARCTSTAGGGPGIVLGEVVAYWKNPIQAEIAFEPTEIRFGKVDPLDTATRNLRIRNIGSGPLQISIPGQGGDRGVFRWAATNAAALQPNGLLEVKIEFQPRQAGVAQTTLSVQADAIGPHSVNVTGTGKSGIPK